jgi:hypothetical protein
VARDPGESGSAFRGFRIQRNRCIRNRDFAIPDRATEEAVTWRREISHVHRGSAFRDSR